MMQGRLRGLAALLLALAGPVGARETQVALLARAGTSPSQRAADEADCKRLVDKAPGSDMPAVERTMMGGSPGDAGLPGVAGVAIVGLIFGMIENGRAETRGVALCMQNRGYVPVPLTAAEQKAYQALPPAQRGGWEQTFLGGDLDARIAEAARPLVPPLPDYIDQPQMIGGLWFDVDNFVAAPAAVREGGSVLSGTLQRVRTAVLAADFASSEGPVTIAGKAGAVFHQVDYRPQREPVLREPGATWCGPVAQRSGGAEAPSVYCLTSGQYGYQAFRPSGFAWLAGPAGAGFRLPLLRQPVSFAEREADELGPIDFAIRLDQVRVGSLTLSAVASRGGQKVRIWERRLKPDRDGRYSVALWQRRLVLTVDVGLNVTAQLAPGDGTNLRDSR
jgi:hypothetical protein